MLLWRLGRGQEPGRHGAADLRRRVVVRGPMVRNRPRPPSRAARAARGRSAAAGARGVGRRGSRGAGFGRRLEQKRDGEGTLQEPAKGSSYTGWWANDFQEGIGREDRPGESYQGAFLRGERSGRGTETRASGDTYIGEWARDRPHGWGRQFVALTGERFAGTFRGGVREGPGEVRGPPGGWPRVLGRRGVAGAP